MANRSHDEPASPGMTRQLEIYEKGLMGLTPKVPPSYEELAGLARKRLKSSAYDYLAGGAGNEETIRANEAAFRRRCIVPRMARGVAVRDLSVRVIGSVLSTPFLLAPIGVLSIVHKDAELAVARAARSLNVPMILSTVSSTTIEDVANELAPAHGWFQLYPFGQVFPHPGLSWEEIVSLRALTRMPILLKGILHPDDARRGQDLGVDGIIVSNHGGRQVDGAIAALDALPQVVSALKGRIDVLFDSGIRRGVDVLKALALGARAVLVGRPYAFGLAIAGQEGVEEVMRNLIADFDLTLGLAGCSSASSLNSDYLAAPAWISDSSASAPPTEGRDQAARASRRASKN
jgi:isopentenyl diphosphate isomerase/L-lactate dehydrogenase-like FMN-dependent dehydrogenase